MQKPNRIGVIVDSTGIKVDNGSGYKPDKVWAGVGGQVHFDITNNDTVAHTVQIPIAQFVPSPAFGDATPDPMVPGQVDNVHVAGGGTGRVSLNVKPHGHFGWQHRSPWKEDHSKIAGMTYKYTVHATGLPPLDPDIEINQ
ncbi:MAG TPA: hypothetical protein VEK56_11590 [Vicinamibacterales bacterium]|nr:hypothetical protein [Vicinamibacterales bacterium]